MEITCSARGRTQAIEQVSLSPVFDSNISDEEFTMRRILIAVAIVMGLSGSRMEGERDGIQVVDGRAM